MVNAERVVAVVVTYNRLALLRECVEALREQTYKLASIIVVNNSSTDGTEEWLLQQGDINSVTQPNLGGAYGFYTGMKTAVEEEYEWIWCMDDDGHPRPAALEKLMDFHQQKPCVMNALVCDKEDPDNLVFKTGPYTKTAEISGRIVKDAANFFNGTLLHLHIIKAVGLPLKELVIWGDESEYYNRIRYKFGFPLFTVSDSIHLHPAQGGLFYKKEWDIRKEWKPYFYVRNKIFVFLSKYRTALMAYTYYTVFLLGFATTIVFYQKENKLRKMKLLFVGAIDGYRKDTGKTIADVKKLLAIPKSKRSN
jgi:rhamnopyranosyl-N-acetylglucosaminyl-diphospho-decaprenol beta-1,3/1,4-galactofuranosyltransferase